MQVAAPVVTDMCLPDALEPAEIERIIAVANEGGQKLERLLLSLFRNHSELF
jgi:purine-nucleoside phosphorylase